MIRTSSPSGNEVEIPGADLYLEGFEGSEPAHILSEPIPDHVPDYQLAESFQTQSIAAMTQTDREHAYNDIHAIPEAKKEDPVLISRSLELLEEEILKRDDNEAYLKAQSLNPAYVGNREFRLMFLRTDRFDVPNAALRMVRHFQIKLDLFGKNRLGRDITQDDMTKEDMEALRDPIVRLLPTRDRAGRAIIHFVSNSANHLFSLEARMRRLFYLFMLSLRDSDTQKRGIVVICCYINNTEIEGLKSGGFDGAWKSPRLALGIPIHIAAVHMGYNSMRWAPVHAILRMTLGIFTRIRFRAHYGSNEEWINNMKSVGIQPEQLPFRTNAENFANLKFLEVHRAKERMKYPKRSRVGVPGPNDVLFGKGSRFQNHVGNVKFRRFIADCRKTYEKTKRGEKQHLIREIVDTVTQSSGLFLKEDDEGWIVVDDAAAAYKVGAVFRTLRTLDG
ncbi:unnamed protein product [Cylindrotheca closterium]|uniref:DUF6824 domain-containing protein n=1 Tax=Cylindrotheca closterium TaxID=2856 RepID=A0AAD2FNL3_9STRA|nr:unnamed protein product [Cylindrotheca closterium]